MQPVRCRIGEKLELCIGCGWIVDDLCGRVPNAEGECHGLLLGDGDAVAVGIGASRAGLGDGEADVIGACAAVLVHGIGLGAAVAVAKVPEVAEVVADGVVVGEDGVLPGGVGGVVEVGGAGEGAPGHDGSGDAVVAGVGGEDLEGDIVGGGRGVGVADRAARCAVHRAVAKVPIPGVDRAGGGGGVLKIHSEHVHAISEPCRACSRIEVEGERGAGGVHAAVGEGGDHTGGVGAR